MSDLEARWRVCGNLPPRVCPIPEDLSGELECENEADALLVCRLLNERDELLAALEDLRRSGAHEGPCTNEALAHTDEPCYEHLHASHRRERRASDLLRRIREADRG